MRRRGIRPARRACALALLLGCRDPVGGKAGDTGDPGHSDETGDSTPSAAQRCPDDRSWINVAAGDLLTCGVHGDGCIECWGGFDGPSSSYDTGAWVDYGDDEPPEGVYTSTVLSLGEIGAGSWHACALDDAGLATCWGKNDVGQANPPSTPFSDLALGGDFSCGLAVDGTISCWGLRAERLELPDPTTSSERYVTIAAGLYTVCAIDDLGDIQCWDSSETDVQRSGPWTELSTFLYTCAVAEDRPIECWATSDGAEVVNEEIPTEVGYVDVCLGYLTSGCALSADGQIECWGEYYVDRHLDSYLAATEYTYASLSCGQIHACGVTTDGSAQCWGSNGEGQTDVPP